MTPGTGVLHRWHFEMFVPKRNDYMLFGVDLLPGAFAGGCPDAIGLYDLDDEIILEHLNLISPS
jgi:hypothetical protein